MDCKRYDTVMIQRPLQWVLIGRLARASALWQSLLLGCALVLTAHASIAEVEDYTLNAGDTIRIYVYGEPDLTFEGLLIGQRGRISYPFLGEIEVERLAVNDVQNLITNGLKPDYLIDPRVSVSITQYRPFFVNGEVKNPGSLDFQPGLTLRKAISLAGGFTARANKKDMLVIADNAASAEGVRVGLDYRIRPGDIITITDTFF
jgi:protein involved in polysaccharide export with SLBB domain